MIKAVIFDLGGTLIEYAGTYQTWPLLETPGLKAAHQRLTAAGVPQPPFTQFQETGFALLPGRWQQATAGERNLRVVELIAEILATNGFTAPETAVLDEAAQAYEAAIQSQAQPIDGAQTLLAELQASGYRLGLISNTMFRGEAHLADLARFGLDGYFQATLFSADKNMWKPNQAPFTQMVTALGVPAAAAVYVGDDPANDVVGSQGAGLRAIHIRSSDRFVVPHSVRADAVINHLAELPAVLSSWQ